MNSFEYGDEKIGELEIFYIVASYTIGAGVLSIPRVLARATNFFDGWLSYMMAIGVFSATATSAILYPTIELAKEAEVLGGGLGRIESLFFAIWIMSLFTTATLALDAGLIALSSLFQKVKKRIFIFILIPSIYLMAMFPVNFLEVTVLGKYINYSSFWLATVIPGGLLLLAKVRGIKEMNRFKFCITVLGVFSFFSYRLLGSRGNRRSWLHNWSSD